MRHSVEKIRIDNMVKNVYFFPWTCKKMNYYSLKGNYNCGTKSQRKMIWWNDVVNCLRADNARDSKPRGCKEFSADTQNVKWTKNNTILVCFFT